MNALASSLAVVAAELLIAVVCVHLLGRVLRSLIRVVFAMPWLKTYEAAAERIRGNLRIVLWALGLIVGLAIVGFNAYLIYGGQDPLRFLVGWARSITQETWLSLGKSAAAILGLALATTIAVRAARRLLDDLRKTSKGYEGIQANDESIDQFFDTLRDVVFRAGWWLFLIYASRWMGFPESLTAALAVTLRVYLIVAIGWLLYRAMDVVVATLDAVAEKYADTKDLSRYYRRLRGLVPLLRRVAEAALYLIVATLAARQVEAAIPVAAWTLRLLKIVGYFFVSRVAIELIKLLIEEVLITRPKLTDEAKKRRQTFVPLAQGAVQYGIFFSFVILSLTEIGIDPTPILAGVGILGLAVSFGAQKLVADLVSGFFILFEGHYLVGDFVVINGVKGTVKAIDLRTTHIRSTYGDYVILRNSDIDRVDSSSREFILAVARVPVPYDCDFEVVTKVVDEVGDEMLEAGGRVLTKMRMSGVRVFRDAFMEVMLFLKASPGNRRPVENQMRLRVYRKLREYGMATPIPPWVLSWQGDVVPADVSRLDLSTLAPEGEHA